MYPGPDDLSIDKVKEAKGETWQRSFKIFKCEYDSEHVVADLARKLAETKIKLATMMIANATISGKGSFTKSTNSV
jgi:hypothetical protein